jgi:hypothetical protein
VDRHRAALQPRASATCGSLLTATSSRFKKVEKPLDGPKRHVFECTLAFFLEGEVTKCNHRFDWSDCSSIRQSEGRKKNNIL